MAAKTQIFQFHESNGNLVEFGGFSLPVWFKGIIPECLAVRRSAGIFDVSHMGRVMVSGPGARDFLSYVTTNDVSSLKAGEGQYSLLCNPNGGVKDDITVFNVEAGRYLVVYNAGNRQKDFGWLEENARKFRVKLDDVSDSVAMFAVQGPMARSVIEKISSDDISSIKRFCIGEATITGKGCLVSRTGYTGEDGFEVYVKETTVRRPENALAVWNAILDAGKGSGLSPCGLGSRDVLRLEAGMCLYGNDIDEDTSPVEARLGFVVKLEKPDFVGRASIEKVKREGPKRLRVGMALLEKGIPRAGQEVLADGQKVGKLSSGTYSPILELGIAMGYIRADLAKEDTLVQVRVRDKLLKAKVVKLPFYQRRSEDKILYMGREEALREALGKGTVKL